MSLEKELAIYQANLIALLANEGKFIIIKGENMAGPCDTYEQALEVGYGRFGPVSFLVKQITRYEPILYFSRDLPR